MEMESERLLEVAQFEGLIQGVIDHKYGICDNFLTANVVAGLRENIALFHALGQMQPSGVGNKSVYHQNLSLRGDKIKWLNEDSIDPHELVFLTKMNHFIQHLNTTCYTSIHTFECHYADYEKFSFYKRHLDQFKSDRGRKFSVILYLNNNWVDEDGGHLSLYPSDGDHVQIAPIEGRLVFFKSDELEHEVHPSFNRNRQSIAGWFKTK